MKKQKRFAVVLGTRPEFIKLSSFLKRAPQAGIELLIIHTGQHFDDNMSTIFFRELDLPEPDVVLETTPGQSSGNLGMMFAAVAEVIARERDALDGVIVLGDTFSTLAGALAAARVKIPLIHIEAGLRSFNRRMPEELNRITVDHLSDVLFTTEQSGNDNLLQEGIPKERIHLVGNIGLESFERTRDSIERRGFREQLGLGHKGYRVVTVHRHEHVHDPKILARIFAFLSEIAKKTPVVFPLHPMTREKLKEHGLEHPHGVTIVEPLGYLDFMSLVTDSAGLITDSGGIQEEAAHLGIPCCTVRDTTERPVTVELGSNKLFPPLSLDDAVEDVERHLARTDFIPGAIPLWDTDVSKRIIERLL